MIPEEQSIVADRMRFTKDSASANLILLAIVSDCLYFVKLYQLDVGSYFYTWVIGASIIYNLVFMLAAFLSSEGVKSRKGGYTPLLLALAAMQVVRIFYVPWKAYHAVAQVNGVEVKVMGTGAFLYMAVCLAVSALCLTVAALNSQRNNKVLAAHMQAIQKTA